METNLSQDINLDELTKKVDKVLGKSKNCAQTSFAVLQEEFALDGGPILKAITPFPGIAFARGDLWSDHWMPDGNWIGVWQR